MKCNFIENNIYIFLIQKYIILWLHIQQTIILQKTFVNIVEAIS